MTKFNISCDLLVPVLLEIEADNIEIALDLLHEMPKTTLLKQANTEESALGILEGSEIADQEMNP